MKKILSLAFMFIFMLFSQAHASTLTEAQKEQAIHKMTKMVQLTDNDIFEHKQFLNQASDSEVKSYLSSMIYDYEKQIDNPNSIDLMDIKLSLEKKSLLELIK